MKKLVKQRENMEEAKKKSGKNKEDAYSRKMASIEELAVQKEERLQLSKKFDEKTDRLAKLEKKLTQSQK